MARRDLADLHQLAGRLESALAGVLAASNRTWTGPGALRFEAEVARHVLALHREGARCVSLAVRSTVDAVR